MNEVMEDFTEAEREQVYGQVAIIGPSGSGKTIGALKIAYGMTGDWSKIGLVDTEHKRSKVYVGTNHTGGTEIGKFKHLNLSPPYTVEKFSEAMNKAIKAGLEVVIFDSFSHEWEGTGGITDWANDLGGEFRHWKKPKLAHKALIDDIMHAPIHVIATIRTKQEYVIVPGGGTNGKSSVEKLGMKPVQSGDIDYEFLVAFTANMENASYPTKDNTGLFKGMNDLITEDHGRMLKEWLIEGKEVESVEDQNKAKDDKRQKLVEYFTKKRNETQKSQAWYTNKEIAAGSKIPEWPLEVLEKLYNQLKEAAEKRKAAAAAAAPKPEPESKPEEPAPTPEPEPEPEHTPGSGTLDRTMIISDIVKMRVAPEVDKIVQDFLGKSKVEDLTKLNNEQLLFALTLAERRTKTLEQGLLV